MQLSRGVERYQNMGGENCKEKLLQMKSIVVDFSGQMPTPAGGNKKFKTLAKLLDFLQKKSQNIMGGITARPRDTRSQAAWTLTMHVFE